ncbi:MAG: hypothetical protein JWM27_2555 [Gemmatimonadetes bacterium]|nr:hypothetical protein [Gemmatimonadota bacterium]
MRRELRLVRAAALFLAPALLLAACGDSTGTPQAVAAETAVVVNSTNRSLTVQPLGALQGRTVGLGSQGSPVSVATRGNFAVVPMGSYPYAAVVELFTGAVGFVKLPDGSGATGAAFLNDSIAVVANSNLNTVSPVNIRRLTAGAPIAVGGFPQSVVAEAGRLYVINAELVDFAPAKHGTVTVLDGSLNKVGTVQLSGDNPAAGAFLDGKLYVVDSGSYGAGDGAISVVDPVALTEAKQVAGFGNFPGAVAAGADKRVYVGVYGTGIVVWNPATGTFVNDVAHPLLPAGSPVTSAVGFDSQGRLYSLNPGECKDPGKLFRLTAGGASAQEFTTGVCPFALAFTGVTPLPD